MSVVSSYVILTSVLEDEEEILAQINAFAGLRGAFVLQIDDHAGGNKVLQSCIFAGAFNMLDDAAFCEHLSRVPWNERQSVRVFLNREHDEHWFEVLLWADSNSQTLTLGELRRDAGHPQRSRMASIEVAMVERLQSELPNVQVTLEGRRYESVPFNPFGPSDDGQSFLRKKK